MNEQTVNIMGTIAAVLTTISFLPQAIKTITTKCTDGISILMYLAYTVGIFIWCVYGYYVKDNILLISSVIAFLLALPIMVLTIKNTMQPKEISSHGKIKKGIVHE